MISIQKTKWKVEDPHRPELVIGLVGAVGTDLERVSRLLQQSLSKQIGYSSHEIRLSSLLREYDVWDGGSPPAKGAPEDDRIDAYMKAGTALRVKGESGDIVAKLALAQICEERGGSEALRDTAFILRSLKHADEARFLQRLYGPGFILIGAYSSRAVRRDFLRKAILQSRKVAPRILSAAKVSERIEELMERDSYEEGSSLGQQVRKTYHLSDFFVDVDRDDAKTQIDRFIRLLFSYPHHTPMPDEHAMFIAHAAATRSGSLARQVGSAITLREGDIISVGCNEVAKLGGGQAWEVSPDPAPDRERDRDFDRGFDTTSRRIKELTEDSWTIIWKRLKKRLAKLGHQALVDKLDVLEDKGGFPGSLSTLFKGTKLRDLIEFYREVHAETSALMTAARYGIPVRRGTLYSTTFPCHECAKHIVAAGLTRVVYVEPYPKSKATDFYPSAFGDVDTPRTKLGKKRQGLAESFVGVGPRRYRDLFSLVSSEGREIERKDSEGDVKKWNGKVADLRWRTWSVSYLDAEPWHVRTVKTTLDKWRIRSKK